MTFAGTVGREWMYKLFMCHSAYVSTVQYGVRKPWRPWRSKTRDPFRSEPFCHRCGSSSGLSSCSSHNISFLHILRTDGSSECDPLVSSYSDALLSLSLPSSSLDTLRPSFLQYINRQMLRPVGR